MNILECSQHPEAGQLDCDACYIELATRKVIKTADEATQIAIDWQNWASQVSLSYGELAEAGKYFAKLAEKFPELKEEFKENAII